MKVVSTLEKTEDRLFVLKDAQKVFITYELSSAYPLGIVSNDLLVNSRKISLQSPTFIEQGSDKNVHIIHWNMKECIVELLKAKFHDTVLDDTWVYIWRIKSHVENLQLKFSIIFDPYDHKCEGFPNSGERFMAITWELGQQAMTIATGDDECYATRATRAYWMPQRLENTKIIGSYLLNAMEVAFPTINQAEAVQVEFFLAYASGENSDTNSWLGVAQNVSQVLQQLHIQ